MNTFPKELVLAQISALEKCLNDLYDQRALLHSKLDAGQPIEESRLNVIETKIFLQEGQLEFWRNRLDS